MKKIFLSEATKHQIFYYFAKHPEQFELPHNYNELAGEVRFYKIVRNWENMELVFLDFLKLELFRVKLDYNIQIEVDGRPFKEEIPLFGRLF